MNRELQQFFNEREKKVGELGITIAQPGEKDIDFTDLSELSQNEENVLPVSIESLEQSFQDGMSAVFLQGRRTVGHARFIPLLDERLITALRLPPYTPQIWEMGTGLMLPEVRGKGINIVLRHVLVSKYREQMASGRVLVIATTKTPELRSLVDNMADLFTNSGDEYPLDFRFTNRENLPFIAPFTCVCHPEFGTGFQYGNYCGQAEITSENIVQFRRGVELPLIGTSEKKKLKCTIFVSSTSLAQQTNKVLSQRFETQSNLVEQLKDRSYFDD